MDVSLVGDVAVLAVHGSVDLTTAPALRDRVAALIDDGHLCIVADLTECDFLDSTGLGALVAAVKRLRARDGEIRIVTTSGHVRQVFEITSLDRIFALFTTLEEAIS